VQKRIGIVIALMMMTVAGVAQIPTAGNVFLGYSFYRGNTGASNTGNLNGWEGSLEGRLVPHVGMVADVSAQYGTLRISTFNFGDLDSSTRVQSYLFGPRISASVGKFRPFAHVLVGASHLHESNALFSNSETDFSDAIGGGIDYHLIPRVSWRLQLDDLQTRFNGGRQDVARFSTGLALRF